MPKTYRKLPANSPQDTKRFPSLDAQHFIGQTFNRLTVLGNADSLTGRLRKWICTCACGNTMTAIASNIKRGVTKSCGCLVTTHGMWKSAEYRIWIGMKARCKPSHKSAKDYFERGIDICVDWQNDFAAFYREVGPRPSPQYTIERVDNDRGYEPGNVRWATRRDQSLNNRRTVMLTRGNITMCQRDWARYLGIHESSLIKRLKRWPLERALTPSTARQSDPEQ